MRVPTSLKLGRSSEALKEVGALHVIHLILFKSL